MIRTISKTHSDGLQYIEVLPAGTKTLADKVMHILRNVGRKFDRLLLGI